VTVSPGEASAHDRAAVILTPDQRVRVFVSSTLKELAEERAAALRAIRRLHLIPIERYELRWTIDPAHFFQKLDLAVAEHVRQTGAAWRSLGVGP
jgi:Domain of unknown function (DUF4062)